MDNVKNVYFIGVGGVSMSAIAPIFYSLGYKIYGTDINEIKMENLTFFKQNNQVNMPDDIDLVIYNTDIKSNHPDLLYAKNNNKKIIHRVQALELITSNKTKIAISGRSGKTSTTFYIGQLLTLLDLDPHILVGESNFNGKCFKEGNGPYVVELNEADMIYGEESSNTLVLTNFGLDHIWQFSNEEEMWNLYKRLIKNSKKLIFFSEEPKFKDLEGISVGFNDNSTYKITNLEHSLEGIKFNLNYKNQNFLIESKVLGKFNAINITMAIAAIKETFNISVEKIVEKCKYLKNSKRRMEIIVDHPKITIIDDQALHPLEISACLETAKEWDCNIHALIDPFRPIRVQTFLEDFIKVAKNINFCSPYKEISANHIKNKEDFFLFLDNIININSEKKNLCFLFFKDTFFGEGAQNWRLWALEFSKKKE